MRNYYERRAAVYDDVYLGRGAYSGHDLPGLRGGLAEVIVLVEDLPPAKVARPGRNTGSITRLPGI